VTVTIYAAPPKKVTVTVCAGLGAKKGKKGGKRGKKGDCRHLRRFEGKKGD